MNVKYQTQTICSPSITILDDIASRRNEKIKIVFYEFFPTLAAIFYVSVYKHKNLTPCRMFSIALLLLLLT